MKSVTIHGLDDELDKRISQEAKKKGLSRNKTVKLILAQSLNLSDKKIDHSSDFKEFLGIWSEEDAKEFESAVVDFSKIDESDWE